MNLPGPPPTTSPPHSALPKAQVCLQPPAHDRPEETAIRFILQITTSFQLKLTR